MPLATVDDVPTRRRIRFSLIIPAYNEEAYLPRLLDTVDRARNAYHGRADAIEVIVADNSSTDATARIARERGCTVVPVAKRVIAAARNGGASVARGELLAFIDADSQIHPDTFNEIDRAFATGKVVAGTTSVDFERTSLGIRCTNILLIVLGVLIRGARARQDFNVDTGVVFCRRADFQTIGGYCEDMLWAEDVQFLLDLRRLGRTRGERLTRGLKARAIFCTRKFDQHGDWHYFTVPSRLMWELIRRREAIARAYWYEVR